MHAVHTTNTMGESTVLTVLAILHVVPLHSMGTNRYVGRQ